MRILYSKEFANSPASAEDYWKMHKVSDAMRENAMRLVEGVDKKGKEIDALIKASAENWPLERMAIVDKNILRVAIFELTECPDVPTAVVVDEALEIAKNYASPESVPFIHGILGKVSNETRHKKSDA